MKRLILTALLITILSAPLVYAEPKGRVIPYGDYCSCRNYGICKKELKHKEAILAIETYFKKKNLFVKNISSKGRFIKADIYKGEKLVDRVIFDRKTGRLRSIY
ncbi:MAG: hypothetical protein HY805_05980 [Nitrospirae bacterium]|nr:hypothetical protein [Nitrospirota bacterium]